VFTPTQAELSPETSIELHARQRRELEAWCEPLLGLASVSTVLHDGDPPEALLDAALHHEAACVGAHHLSDVTGLRLGRISLQLLDRGAAPMILVPPPPSVSQDTT